MILPLLSLVFNLSSYAVESSFFNSPNGVQEICELPSSEVFSKGDQKDLKKLCKIDFYGLTENKKTHAICPKLNSTNPGVNVYEIKGEDIFSSKEKTEGELCKNASLEAKYKQSISCSYYPSILGYYYLSLYLKGPKVPAAVYRTMDKDEHNKISKIGVANTKGLLNTIWKQFNSWETSSNITGKKARLFTDDLSQIAGALSENPKGEKRYTAIMGLRSKSGGRCSYENRATCFKENPATGYPALSSLKEINKTNYPLSFEDGVRLVQKLKDISEMLVMDHIMSQGDRFGNQHYREYYFYQTLDGKIKKEKVKNFTLDKENKQLVSSKDPNVIISYVNIATAPVLLMKDNDCGIIKQNVVKNNKLVAGIRHLNHKFYQRLISLQGTLSTKEGEELFKVNGHFTDSDYRLVKSNVDEVVESLKSSCQKGELQFDLSQEQFFSSKESKENFSCL